MKPWEETWNADPRDDEYVSTIGRVGLRGDGRAPLASAAPDMARVLLAVEWSGKVDYVGDGGYECCPSCCGVAPGFERLTDAVDDIARGRSVAGHKRDCVLDAALRKAGVR
jgi:hypothetical protein